MPSMYHLYLKKMVPLHYVTGQREILFPYVFKSLFWFTVMAQNTIKEFITRTHKLLKQYDDIKLDTSERYEITLRLNAYVGLLLVGQQHFKSAIPLDYLENIGLSTKKVLISKDHRTGADETINTQTVSRHLRNSIAHARFEFINENGMIQSIRFLDKRGRMITFDMTLTCDEFIKYTDWLFHVFINPKQSQIA